MDYRKFNDTYVIRIERGRLQASVVVDHLDGRVGNLSLLQRLHGACRQTAVARKPRQGAQQDKQGAEKEEYPLHDAFHDYAHLKTIA